jgi:hypothetical protein
LDLALALALESVEVVAEVAAAEAAEVEAVVAAAVQSAPRPR